MKIHRKLLVGIGMAMLSTGAFAQSTPRNYSQEHPLVYEDADDYWPYSFTNEKGEPDGFNIDLIHMIFEELQIPYVIKLKPNREAFEDLRANRSDLTIGIADGFHDRGNAMYGKNPILLLTQSVASPKSKPADIQYFRDLGQHQVIVSDSSFCHYLMIYYQWEHNAIPTDNILEALQQVSSEEEGNIVWNTLSLKWLIHKYQMDNLELTPVNMPHAEYKFMSHDSGLLNTLDSIYAVLNSGDRLAGIQNKWFYPEHNQTETPIGVWYLLGLTGFLALLFLIYVINYRLHERAINRENNQHNKRLALINETCKVRIWTYDVNTKLFTWRNEKGEAAHTFTADEFALHYHPEDFTKVMDILHQLEEGPEDEDKEMTIDIEAIDPENAQSEWRDYTMTLSILRREKDGHPSLILITKKDITEQHRQERQTEERELLYKSAFGNPIIGILQFDHDGYLININKRGCDIFCCDHDAIIAEHVSYHDILGLQDLKMSEANGHQFTQSIDFDKIPEEQRKVHSCKRTGIVYYEARLSTVTGDHGEMLGMFAFFRDTTFQKTKTEQLHKTTQKATLTRKELDDYINAINFILDRGDVRMVNYSPTSHTLTIFRHIDDVQLTLTQTRCMTFVDNLYRRKTMYLIERMDDRQNKDMETDIKTTIRGNKGLPLSLYFHMYPVKNSAGVITEYFGLCRDVSELKKAESLMDIETTKAQEIENTQNKFLRNMMKEIRTPLNIVVDLIGKLDADHQQPNEAHDIQTILINSQRLLQLINNILYMSRLEAHMVEIKPEPCDFAEAFEKHCQTGWAKYKYPNVRYVVEKPYEKLVVDIDANNLGKVIERVVDISARSTHNGTIRARYDYIGGKLMISIDDTGEGLAPEELKHIQTQYSKSGQSSKTLDLSICKELIDQMGGTFEMNSEKGLGTTTWITLPCTASVVKRRKTIN